MKNIFRAKPIILKSILSLVALGFTLSVGLSSISVAVNPKEVRGIFTFVDGQARKQKIGEENWQAAETKTPVEGGERVKTLIRTRAEIQLAELDIIRLAPKTTVDIVKLFQEGKDKKRETEIDLREGDIWANIGSLDENASLDLNTAVANAAVKGTLFRVSVGEDNTTELKVYNGAVNVSGKAPKKEETEQSQNKSENLAPQKVGGPKQVKGPKEVSMKEWTVIVREMQKIIISADSKVAYHGEFSLKDKAEQTDWVKWNRKRDLKMGLKLPVKDELSPFEKIKPNTNPDTSKSQTDQPKGN